MKTVIGLDFGTQSARAVLVNTATGQTIRSDSRTYPHGILPGDLVDGKDFRDVLFSLLEAVTACPERDTIVGICVDATSMTLIGVDSQGTLLSQLPELAQHPHALGKLWKCHSAEPQAREALALARKFREPFLGRTGGSISSEWTLPKLLKIRDEDPLVYRSMDIAFDLCDYLTYLLTGTVRRSIGSMSYKSLWFSDLGFPGDSYLDALRPGFSEEYNHLLRGEICLPGACAGVLRPELCERFGLNRTVRIAAGILDGHTALVALGAIHPGDAALVVGTSNVLTIQTPTLREVEGICGIAYQGQAPGLYGIDSGQCCTGDMLQWFVTQCVPQSVTEQAKAEGISVHELLCRQISAPCENRLTAVDWWNGSRNTPCDLSLPGAMVGQSTQSTAPQLYLSLLQGIVCGTKEIIDQCQRAGVEISRVFATGGITQKNPLLMQQYANILGCPVLTGQNPEGPALGAAIFAALAAEVYSTLEDAYQHMGIRSFSTYIPDEEHLTQYRKLFERNHKLRQLLIQLYEEEDGYDTAMVSKGKSHSRIGASGDLCPVSGEHDSLL